MGALLKRLAEKRVLVSDGAWGTMLYEKGLKAGECPELWNVDNPDAVQSVAAAYADAGSDVVLTNTFGGTNIKLKKFGIEGRVAELNKAGAVLSVAGAPNAIIAGSVGPTGEFMEPFGTMTANDMKDVFKEQIEGLLAGGVHAICVETMTALDEAACAVEAAKALAPEIDVICTFTFDPAGDGYRTMMGVDPAQMAETLIAAGADVVGSNCGNGIEQMIDITRAFRAVTDKPVLIHANAGAPEMVDGKTVFRQTPEIMASHVAELVEAGVSILGGCCGTTPAHIKAIRQQLDSCF